MTCEVVDMPDGGRAIVCYPGKRKPTAKPCACGSGQLADLLCDWKTPEGPAPTCDKPLCPICTYKPAGFSDKDLCPAHAFEWRVRQAFKEPAPAEAQSTTERNQNGRSSPNYDGERAANRNR
jgi:hypothetical protein